MKTRVGTITLIGSGELSEAMSWLYRRILSKLDRDVNAVMLDTPAGFELNVDEISAKAVEYFAQHLSVNLQVASFKNRERASALEVEEALRKLLRANIIFAGPGSPSYAIRNWRRTAVWDTLVNRLLEGGHVVLASAAAITAGSHALPVYEIYKVGEDPDWIQGLNLLARFGLSLAVIPHWNNTEGGSFDTRFCFMGAPRWDKLEAKLGYGTVILGLDEYTACIVDPDTQQCEVMGAGQVTVRCDGREWQYPSGTSFGFDRLRAADIEAGARPAGEPGSQVEVPAKPPVETQGAAADATRYLHQLANALVEAHEGEVQRDLIEHAHDTMHELSAEWSEADHFMLEEDVTPFVEVLIEVRSKLRASRQYALADIVRQRLAQLGITLEDAPNGTRWKMGSHT